jgi:iron(III) transport system ATP-binding protein
MRRGAIEQLGRPDEIFEEPATEYVAEFIGMANRLLFERRDGGWTYEGALVETGLGWLDTASSAVAARVRSEDVHLAPLGSTTEWPETISLPATVAASEFGGRHLDVVVNIGSTRVLSRIPAGDRGSWARSLAPGQPVVALLRKGDAAFYNEAGALLTAAGRPVAVAT